MLSTILDNLYAFALSMPTNMIIMFVIALILKVCFKKPIGFCVRVILGYLLVGFLLGIFGINMPNIMTVGRWIADTFKKIFGGLW
jgi:hypothetical protein